MRGRARHGKNRLASAARRRLVLGLLGLFGLLGFLGFLGFLGYLGRQR